MRRESFSNKSNRRPYEFSRLTIDTAFRQAENKCEDCGKNAEEAGKTLEAHHVLPIYIARLVPELAPMVIKSMLNCEILCYDCHLSRHRKKESEKDYLDRIEYLLATSTIDMFASI